MKVYVVNIKNTGLCEVFASIDGAVDRMRAILKQNEIEISRDELMNQYEERKLKKTGIQYVYQVVYTNEQGNSITIKETELRA